MAEEMNVGQLHVRRRPGTAHTSRVKQQQRCHPSLVWRPAQCPALGPRPRPAPPRLAVRLAPGPRPPAPVKFRFLTAPTLLLITVIPSNIIIITGHHCPLCFFLCSRCSSIIITVPAQDSALPCPALPCPGGV
ncbi:hypothetical protein M758_12G186100 [Ceratodon purpureus]|nr:hypothetical protein M758_12G186100 [Ceratodon purpureus]